MRKRLLLLACAWLMAMANLRAQEPEQIPMLVDSAAVTSDTLRRPSFIKRLVTGEGMNLNFMIIPTVGLQPETNWAFGLAGAYYFKHKDNRKTSSVGFNTEYTLNNQFSFYALSTIYFGGSQRWMLYANASFRRYPDYFYGRGNLRSDLLATPLHYQSSNIYYNIQPQYFVTKRWLVGPSLAFRWENATTSAPLDSVQQIVPTTGFENYVMVGIGALVSYDSRDDIIYTKRGMFFKGIVNYYEPHFGSAYRMMKITTDFRHFVPIYKDLIFAWQFSSDWAIGDKKPFQLMPTFGGLDMMRGLRRQVWVDDVMLALQAELRIPIWGIFKAAVFGGIGDVYSLNHWQFTTPKIGYGAGLRVKVNKSNVNLRFDVARQNYGDNWSFYFTVNEAF